MRRLVKELVHCDSQSSGQLPDFFPGFWITCTLDKWPPTGKHSSLSHSPRTCVVYVAERSNDERDPTCSTPAYRHAIVYTSPCLGPASADSTFQQGTHAEIIKLACVWRRRMHARGAGAGGQLLVSLTICHRHQLNRRP